MEYTKHYNNWAERKAYCDEAVANGYSLLHDDFDPDYDFIGEPHGTLTFAETLPPTPEQLYQQALAAEFNAAHEQAISALKNWGSLTLTQKDAILKSLVKWALWKDGYLKLGVL